MCAGCELKDGGEDVDDEFWKEVAREEVRLQRLHCRVSGGFLVSCVLATKRKGQHTSREQFD